jgi:ribonuclease HI
MKLSEMISEYVDLKIEGEPSNDWASIDQESKDRAAYWTRLQELADAIDAVNIEAVKPIPVAIATANRTSGGIRC